MFIILNIFFYNDYEVYLSGNYSMLESCVVLKFLPFDNVSHHVLCTSAICYVFYMISCRLFRNYCLQLIHYMCMFYPVLLEMLV